MRPQHITWESITGSETVVPSLVGHCSEWLLLTTSNNRVLLKQRIPLGTARIFHAKANWTVLEDGLWSTMRHLHCVRSAWIGKPPVSQKTLRCWCSESIIIIVDILLLEVSKRDLLRRGTIATMVYERMYAVLQCTSTLTCILEWTITYCIDYISASWIFIAFLYSLDPLALTFSRFMWDESRFLEMQEIWARLYRFLKENRKFGVVLRLLGEKPVSNFWDIIETRHLEFSWWNRDKLPRIAKNKMKIRNLALSEQIKNETSQTFKNRTRQDIPNFRD